MNQLCIKKGNSFIPNAGSKRFENEQKMHEILVTGEHSISLKFDFLHFDGSNRY